MSPKWKAETFWFSGSSPLLGVGSVALWGLLVLVGFYRLVDPKLSVEVSGHLDGSVSLAEDVKVLNRQPNAEFNLAAPDLLNDRIVVVGVQRASPRHKIPARTDDYGGRLVVGLFRLPGGDTFSYRREIPLDVTGPSRAEILEARDNLRVRFEHVHRHTPIDRLLRSGWVKADAVHEQIGSLGQPNGLSLIVEGSPRDNANGNTQNDLPPVWILIPGAKGVLIAGGFLGGVWLMFGPGLDDRRWGYLGIGLVLTALGVSLPW